MILKIPYKSEHFPSRYCVGSGVLTTSWNELLWAALTIGRPSTSYVFQQGEASLYEALFRCSIIRMAVEQSVSGRLRRTSAFAALDPTEKGSVSYFLGMTVCKLFAAKLLNTPWLLHLDVFRKSLNPWLLGRSRPDLVGMDDSGRWHAFESKGRSATPSANDKQKAKDQGRRLIAVDGTQCSLHVGSFAYFKSDILHFYWQDPEPEKPEPIRLPSPGGEWRYYYEPALSLAVETEATAISEVRDRAGVSVKIHPELREMLSGGLWDEANERSRGLREFFRAEGFQPDGLKVTADESWQRPFDSIG